ncbi:disease resistance protein L6-like [Syzygium oleosum]|uniref:disease resistance protein L6-like n=1 Tax=Syzygium oleosum TaxID=219896 RepID=UPI0024BA8071|nr:disease resistance protein L6-like [Syzygium oleosum]
MSSYEVFLSFRGPDTRNHFADFLYTMLIGVGIRVFRDEEELLRGSEILPHLTGAIQQSKISIPVISKEYASSRSCLMELVQMVECMDNNEQTIIPIFYHVNPSDVRKCTGPFELALDEPQKCALSRIGDLKGHHLLERSEVYHGKVIKEIVREVELKLKKRDLIVPKHLVGVDPHVQKIKAKLKFDYRNGQAVRIGNTREKVLIYGIPGVGKAVLAKCVYNELHHLYDACSFLEKIQEEIRDHGIVSVQNRLISHLHKTCAQQFDCSDHALTYIQSRFLAMKVILLLDDVKDHEQLSALVGELDWFGPGSTVIVTSRRKNVLQKVSGAGSCVLRTMKQDDALTLFCKHAFETDSPPEKFKQLATDIVATTDGLPLALQKVGESLFGQISKKVWTEKLTALEEAPDKSVQAALEKSYDTLEENEQKIFLDIACFLNGKDQRIPYYMWDDCKFFPTNSIISLQAMSLVEIGEDQRLCMHEILKTFGREIVKNESKDEPWRRSRLCNHEEALDVLKKRKGTKSVEALGLEFADGSEENIIFECDQFVGLQNLRFLKMDQADIRGNFRDHFLSLRWLDWRGCLTIIMDHLNLNLQNLVILDFSRSQVHKDWRGWELLQQVWNEFTIFKHF